MKKLAELYDRLLDRPYFMLASSLFLLLIFMSILAYNYTTRGEIFQKGLDFSGGTQIVVIMKDDFDLGELTSMMRERFGRDVIVKKAKSSDQYLLVVESQGEMRKEDVLSLLEKKGYSHEDASVYAVSAAVSSAFWKQAIKAFIIAFVGMALVVFITFRVPLPSIAIILAAVSDIVAAIALMNLLGIKMTLATFSALLILLGYSVDTDILLSTRVLKRGVGSVNERIKDSVKTGLTMTTTSILAMVALHLLTPSETLKQLSAVIIFGLCADIPFTWIQNASLLKIYLERGGKWS